MNKRNEDEVMKLAAMLHSKLSVADSQELAKLIGGCRPNSGKVNANARDSSDTLLDEDEGYEDDEDDEDEYETIGSRAFFQTLVDGLLDDVYDKVRVANTVQVSRDTIDAKVNTISGAPGVQPIMGQPASGKTTVLPLMVSKKFDVPVMVIVPTTTVLAGAVMSGDKAWIDEDLEVQGSCAQAFYMTMNTFKELHLRGKVFKDTILIFDEMQLGGAYSEYVKGFSDRYARDKLIIQMYGKFEGINMVIPPGYTVKPTQEFRRADHKKTLWLHASRKEMISSFDVESSTHGGEHLMFSALDTHSTVRVLQMCARKSEYVLHAVANEVIGMDIPDLDAVIGLDTYLSNGRVTQTDRSTHIQFMQRAGRRSGVGVYYVRGGKLADRDGKRLQSSTSEDRRAVGEFFRRLKTVKQGQLIRMSSVKTTTLPGLVKPVVKQRDTKVDLGDKPHTIETLSQLPHVAYVEPVAYKVNELMSYIDRGGRDSKEFFLAYYGHLVKSAIDYLNDMNSNVRFVKDNQTVMLELPGFYARYLDFYDWLRKKSGDLVLPGSITYRTFTGSDRLVEVDYIKFGLKT